MTEAARSAKLSPTSWCDASRAHKCQVASRANATTTLSLAACNDAQSWFTGLFDASHGNCQLSFVSSGSFKTDGMVVAPCSMKTLSAIVHSYADSLLVRAADVVLKERRKLVLMPREAPLHVGHCKLLYEAAKLGAVIAPPMPAFCSQPQAIDDLVNHSVGRVLDLFDLDAGILKRWEGNGHA